MLLYLPAQDTMKKGSKMGSKTGSTKSSTKSSTKASTKASRKGSNSLNQPLPLSKRRRQEPKTKLPKPTCTRNHTLKKYSLYSADCIVCDECGLTPLIGNHYGCATTPCSYDLCTACTMVKFPAS